MQTCSIAISPCPNDIYIFAGLILGKITTPDFKLQFEFKDIQQLNKSGLEGHCDIVKVSAAALPNMLQNYEVLSTGGAMGIGVGPLLLVNNRTFNREDVILVPGKNTTANFLLNKYAQRPPQKTYLAFDALYQKLRNTPGTQGVVIHENRFTYIEDGLSLGLDLGRCWHTDTHLPLPLGVIVTRIDKGLKSKMTHLIQESILWARNNSQVVLDLCRRYSQNMQDDVMLSHINLYVNDFSFDMQDEGKRALKALLDLSDAE